MSIPNSQKAEEGEWDIYLSGLLLSELQSPKKNQTITNEQMNKVQIWVRSTLTSFFCLENRKKEHLEHHSLCGPKHPGLPLSV